MKINKHIIVWLALWLSTSVSAQLLPWPIDTIKGTPVYRYTVEKSIGLYRISVNFGVTQSEIIQWNPHLETKGLRYEEVILIPVKQQPAAAPKPQPIIASEPKPIAAPQPRPVQHHRDSIPNIIQHAFAQQEPEIVKRDTTPVSMVQEAVTPIKLAFLLPLHAKALERDKNMDRFYDFYTGALIAAYEAQQYSQRLDIYTYDIEKSDAAIMRVLNDSVLSGVDMIIGPAYASQVALATEWSSKHHIPMLIPFLNTVPHMADNTYLWQFNPTAQAEAEAVAEHLAQSANAHCILIEASAESIPMSIHHLRDAIQQKGVSCSTTTIHAILSDSISPILSDSLENIFIFNTERFSNLQAVLPHLQKLQSTHRVTLYSHYSWQKENIQLPQLYASVFMDSNEESLLPYELLFAEYFHHKLSGTAPRYDLLGYDLTRFVIANRQDTTHMSHQGLQSTMNFVQQGEAGGFMNNAIHIIRK